MLIHNIVLIIKNGKSLSISVQQPISVNTKIITDSESMICFGKDTSTFGNADFTSIAGGMLSIGDKVAFNRNIIVICRKCITIGNGVILGPNVVIYDHDHVFGQEGISVSNYTKKEVVIEDNCWIGANVTILKGTYIGEGSVIGAGCVVKGTIPSHSLVTGSRSLTIKRIENR